MTTSHSTLLRSAIAWWTSYRPIGWTLEQHLQVPHHRLVTTREKRLADAVVDYLNILKGVK